MKQAFLKKFQLVFVVVFVAACSGTPIHFNETDVSRRLDEMGYSDKEAIRDIKNYRLNGWNYVDHYHVVIKSSPRVNYLVEFKTRCHETRSAESIAFSTTIGQVSPGDKVMVRSGPGMTRYCWIDKLYKLTQKPREEKGKQ